MVHFHLLNKSKCDQFRAASVPTIVIGLTAAELCFVTADTLRSGVPTQVTSWIQLGDLTKPWFILEISGILNGIGVPQNQFASHSLAIIHYNF